MLFLHHSGFFFIHSTGPDRKIKLEHGYFPCFREYYFNLKEVLPARYPLL